MGLWRRHCGGSKTTGAESRKEWPGESFSAVSIEHLVKCTSLIPYEVIRACVALRYPPMVARTLYTEAMPPPGVTGNVNFRHQDMHYGNVLLGGLDTDTEHSISPSIKVSQFCISCYTNKSH